MITLLIAFGIGVFMATFWEEILEWGEEMLNSLEYSIKLAWSYVKRVPGAVVKALRYIEGGVIKETSTRVTQTEVLSDADIDAMVPNPLTREQAEELKVSNKLYVQEMRR